MFPKGKRGGGFPGFSFPFLYPWHETQEPATQKCPYAQIKRDKSLLSLAKGLEKGQPSKRENT